MKKVISCLITAMMMFTMIPSIAFAGTDNQPTAQIPNVERNTQYAGSMNLHIEQTNPLYSDEYAAPIVEAVELGTSNISEGGIVPNGSTEAVYAATIDEAAAILRAQMKERQTTVTINLPVTEADLTESAMTAITSGIFTSAMKHTGKVNEGDSLQWVWQDQWTDISVSGDANGLNATITYTIVYYTTAAQEAELDKAVEDLKTDLNLDGKTNYEKVKAIYDYMTANIVYDYEHYGNNDYKLQFTSYAALVNKTSVCQGYATLFYRLACEYGIDARLVAGTSINAQGQPEGHSWNIVKLGSKYYYVDATWDSTYDQNAASHEFFLRGTDNFINHTLEAQFITPEFISAYPMSTTDYVPGSDDDQEESEEPETPAIPENPDQPGDEVTGLWTDYAAEAFAGGSGTEKDPYVIKTAEQLALLAIYVNDKKEAYKKAYYVLGSNIDLAGHNWVPIGAILGNSDNNYWGFEGNFDGKGYSITNMTIKSDLGDYYDYGLFGMNLGTIKNVTLNNPVIKFKSIREGWQVVNGMGSSINVGCLCGQATGDSVDLAIIDNCIVKNAVIDIVAEMGLTCGGVIGSANYVTINDIEISGDVAGTSARAIWVGGSLGSLANYTTVERCSFNGSVKCINDGTIGSIDGEDLTSQGNSYVNYSGGFCGSAGRANSNVKMKNCCAIADIYSESSNGIQSVGGFAGAVGMIYQMAIYENLYCKSTITAVRGNVTSEEYDFWQGESPFGKQEYCESWKYKNCITINDSNIVVRNYSSEVDTTESYKTADVDIQKLLIELGFDEKLWEGNDTTDGECVSHDIVKHDAKESTCTEIGWNAYETCSRCDYTTYKEIPATDHSWGYWNVTELATILDKGEETSICERCSSIQTRDIAKINSINRTYATLVYNGAKRTPVAIKDVNGYTLKAGTDYEVQYLTNCKNVGAHKIKIVLMGKYEGEKTISFTIKPKATTLNKVTSPAKKQIKVTWTKQTAQVTGYQIRYSTKQSMAKYGTAKATSYKTTAKTIKNLKSKQKYYVQIRTYKTVNGKSYYSAWSKAKKVTTK